jgi:hypothetical protein
MGSCAIDATRWRAAREASRATRVSTASLSDGARVASKVDGVPPRRRGDAVS